MIVPYSVDVPMQRVPWANWFLIGFTALFSLAAWGYAHHVDESEERSARELMLLERQLSQQPLPSPEQLKRIHELQKKLTEPEENPYPLGLARDRKAFLTVFTYPLLHGGVLHFLGNMAFLFCFGNAVNAKLGHWQFLVVYFLLGMFAGLAWLALGTGPMLIGASGAIMGIAGVFFVLYPLNNVQVFLLLFPFYFRPLMFEISSCWVVLFAMAWDFFGTILLNSRIAYVCHLGGELVGVGLMCGLLALGYYRPTRGERNLLQVLGLRKTKKSRYERDREIEQEVNAMMARRDTAASPKLRQPPWEAEADASKPPRRRRAARPSDDEEVEKPRPVRKKKPRTEEDED